MFIGTSTGQKVTWKPVAKNGGGFHTGISVADDGTLLCRNDTVGAYKWNGSSWDLILDARSLQVQFYDGYRGGGGCSDVQIAPGNSNYIYAYYNGWIPASTSRATWLVKSIDGGGKFTFTNYPINTTLDVASAYILDGANDTFKRVTNKIGVDPNNELIVYAANPGAYPQVTYDGGNTFSDVPNLPTGTTNKMGACCWQFDRFGGTTVVGGQTRTKNIYCAVEGSGAYLSTDGGVSFSQISASIGVTSPSYATMTDDGVYFLVDIPAGTYTLNRYQSGTWSTKLTKSFRIQPAADPNSNGVIIAILSSGSSGTNSFYWYSSDYGDTWTSRDKSTHTFNTSDANWLANQFAAFTMATACPVFDRANSGRLYGPMGQGFWQASISSSAAPTWSTKTTGMENAVANDIAHESGNQYLFQGFWDLTTFIQPTSNLDTAPDHPVWGDLQLARTYSIAIDPQDHNKIVTSGDVAAYCGYSTDGGSTWQAFANVPTLAGSNSEIMINNGVILWCMASSSNNFWYRSDDFGATAWVQLDSSTSGFTDVPASGTTGWGYPFVFPRRTGCVDDVNANTFYVWNELSGQTPDVRAVYKSTDAGLTWTKGASPFSNSSIRKIKCVPGRQGCLFATAAYDQNSVHPTSNKLMYSSDGGASWTEPNSSMREALFGFGKAAPSSSNPTMLVSGFLNGNYGIYISNDLGVRYRPLVSTAYGKWPYSNSSIHQIEGDKDIYGRFYIAFNGMGVWYCDFV